MRVKIIVAGLAGLLVAGSAFAGKGKTATPEDIRDQFGTISNTEGFTIPDSVADETKALVEALKNG